MKNQPFSQVILLFFLVWAVFIIYSFSDTYVYLGSEKLKKPLRFLFEVDNPHFADSSIKKDSIPAKKEPEFVLDTTKQRILLTGDSMVEGLMFPFKDYCVFNGHELLPAIWYSSSTMVWGQSKQLKALVDSFKPTLIVMALGSNELFIRNIIEDRTAFVQEILKQAGDTKMIWVGPPNWKKDTGINQMLLNELGEKRFYSSEKLKLARAVDGAHPTFTAARVWADSIVHWVQHDSKYRFKLDKAPKKMGKNPGCIFLTGK